MNRKDIGVECATFGAGCFWSVEEEFRNVRGVKNVTVGYSGGRTENPTYNEVCRGKTGHAEVALVEFDPGIVSYKKLLEIFWSIHDPTTSNRQGKDYGAQYRSVIFYHTEEERKEASESKRELEESGKFKDPIVTEILLAGPFYKAEEYHQQYLRKNSLNVCQ